MLMCRPLHSNYRCYTVERCRMKTFYFFLPNEIPRDFYRGRENKGGEEKKGKRKRIVRGTIKRNNREKVYRYID